MDSNRGNAGRSDLILMIWHSKIRYRATTAHSQCSGDEERWAEAHLGGRGKLINIDRQRLSSYY